MLEKRQRKHVLNLVAIAVNWGADEYLSDGERTLQSDLEKELESAIETEYESISKFIMEISGKNNESN